MRIGSASVAADLFQPIFTGSERERVAVLHLDSRRLFLALTLEEEGGESDTELPVGAILARALRLGAAALIVAHNHPSGNPEPSEADLAATRALADAARQVDLKLADHLIFAGGEWRSLYALGLL